MGVKTAIVVGLMGLTSFQNVNKMNNKTLEEKLNELKHSFEQTAPDNLQQLYQDGLDYLRASKGVKQALKLGDKAPDFELTNAKGELVRLSELAKNGSVVLTWYRGGWCPYCNLALKAMQDELSNFKKAGGQLIALTPELPDKSLSTKEKNALDFEVLSDLDNEVARKFGLAFSLKPEVAANYETSFGLSKYNGNDKGELPYPATYVIDQDLIIRYAFVDEDYRLRANPEDITEVLEKIKKSNSSTKLD